MNIFTYKTTTNYIDDEVLKLRLKNEKKKPICYPLVKINKNAAYYLWKIVSFLETFYAASIIGGPGVWLYQSIWFNISDKPGCGARVYCPRNLMLRKSYSWTLVYILPISSFPVLQCEIVSFLLLSFSISLCFFDFVLLKLLDLIISIQGRIKVREPILFYMIL